MGGAASIENNNILNIDYATLKSSSLNFAVAYNVIESKLKKGKSANEADVSLPFLAIRQLSQNLKNQERLDKTRKIVLKSRSLPYNINLKNLSKSKIDRTEDNDELNHTDLDLINDVEFLTPKIEKSQSHGKKKPNLFLNLELADDKEIAPELATPAEEKINININQSARISPRGTLYIGNWKIKETGIYHDDASSPSTPNAQQDADSKVEFSDDFDSLKDNVELNEPLLPTINGKKDFIEIATLGSGASGIVSEALHLPSLTIVALKMIPVYNKEKRHHISRELGVLLKNLSEMKLLDERLTNKSQIFSNDSSDRCANVLSLYNVFSDPKSGMINLVVEYMDGGSLEDLVHQGGCKDERILSDIARQTLLGLNFLHRHKNVHRDIKPANILCSSSGVIKIADFGISKALDTTSGYANSFVGTVCYMSPERITGGTYGFSSDIWSLGLTLLAVSMGRFPLTSKDNSKKLKSNESTSDLESPNVIKGGASGYWAMIKAICDEEPPTPGEESSKEFHDFIAGCLQKNPSDRKSAQLLLEFSFVKNYFVKKAESDFDQHKGGYKNQLLESNLAAHLTSVSIARKASRDQGDDFNLDEYKEDNLFLPDGNPQLNINYTNEEENNIIYSIRLEHLDRILEKILLKIDALDEEENLFAIEETTNSSNLSPNSKKYSFLSENSTDSIQDMFLSNQPTSDIQVHCDSRIYEEQFDPSKYHSILKYSNKAIEIDPPESNFSKNQSLMNSAKSVHFEDNSKIEIKKKSGRFKNLSLLIEDDEDPDLKKNVSSHLPKASSYFLNTKTDSNVIPQSISKSTTSQDLAAEYKKIIPKFDKDGLVKWKNLATQLQLPLPVVIVAVKDKLAKFISLENN